MSKLKWENLEKPISRPVLNVIKDALKYTKMTPVQVSIRQFPEIAIRAKDFF